MALRVRVISQQLCPQPAASKSLEEIVSAALEDAGKYTADMDELKAGGKMPGSTYYDFMQATNHLLLVTAKRDLVPLLHASEQEGHLVLTYILALKCAHSVADFLLALLCSSSACHVARAAAQRTLSTQPYA